MVFLETYLADVKKLCALYNVKSLYAFRSVASGQMTEKSDVDFLVDFNPLEIKYYADNYFDFKFSLQDIFKRQINLVEEKAIRNPYFRQVVNSQRKLVY